MTSLDRGNVVLDFVDDDGTGMGTPELERRYLYSNAVDQILAQENVSETTTSADRIYWMLADNLGTVRDLAANDATIAEHFKYDSFGTIQSGDTALTRYLFTAREWDEAVELQYSRARWYDSGVGRWVSEDPVGLSAGDSNFVRYVGNTPLSKTDPTGHYEVEIAYDGGTDSPTSEQYYEMFFANGYAALLQADATLIGSDGMRDADWLDQAIAFGYGFSDAATLGLAPLAGYVLGHERGLHEDTDLAYGIGVATPIVIVGGASFILPSGAGAPVFGYGGSATAAGAYTTIWGSDAIMGVTAVAARHQRLLQDLAALRAELAVAQYRLSYYSSMIDDVVEAGLGPGGPIHEFAVRQAMDWETRVRTLNQLIRNLLNQLSGQ